ncbi:MAG: S41 family peptidase, partial [Chitinophagales bacterium]|nr:S41 family peptidase [Chitinophagales bacterium]
MRALILFLLLTACTIFTPSDKNIDPEEIHLLKAILKTVEQEHYAPKALDDSLSIQLYNKFIANLDPEKLLFTSNALESTNAHQYQLDEQLKEHRLDFFDDCIALYNESLISSKVFCFAAIQNAQLINQTDIYWETKPEKRKIAPNKKALKEYWEKHIVYLYYQQYFLTQQQQPHLDSHQIAAKVKEQLTKIWEKKWEKLASISRREALHLYLNTYLALNDIQSNYLSLEEKQRWDEAFNRAYVGVGLRLESGINLYPSISEVIPEGGAWKSQQIKKGDILISLENDSGEIIDLAGMEMADIIHALKGEEGSIVNLYVQNSSGKLQKIPVQRTKIDMSKVSVMLLKHQSSEQTMGYLNLPRFYGGNEGVAYHVEQALKKLNQHDIEGVVMDLRNNQGGSAREAIQIISYFLDGGPIMRTRYRNREGNIYHDNDDQVLYKKSLIVLVNDHSSSASELTAGTLQDYGRAVIVGEATYGKGSIQRFFPIHYADTSQAGNIKLTIGHFFTAGGKSPEYQGISPDIKLPGVSKTNKIKAATPIEAIDTFKCLQTIVAVPDIEQLNINSKIRQSSSARLTHAKVYRA